jgi:hypothetical protein
LRRWSGAALSAATIALEIPSRTVASRRSKRWDRLRAGLYLILQQRGADMADLPGGASGLLVLDYRGKDADWLVTRTAPGVVSLVAELLPRARQTAEELGQGKTRGEECKVIDASPAAITLALLLTDEELDSLAKRAGHGEIAERGRPRGSNVASPQPRAMVSLPEYSQPMPRPPAGGRGRMA